MNLVMDKKKMSDHITVTLIMSTELELPLYLLRSHLESFLHSLDLPPVEVLGPQVDDELDCVVQTVDVLQDI